MTEKLQHPLRCETCGHREVNPNDDNYCHIIKDFIAGEIEMDTTAKVGCASHTNNLVLTPTLATHYQQRSQDTGKTVSALVLVDLTALHRKRVAREDRRVFKEIEYERLGKRR
jgi:hypothetical protein